MPLASSSDGCRLFYEVHGPGDGHPLLLLHGFGSSSLLWRHQVAMLAEEGYKAVSLPT